jgi:hypothetical protein
MAQRRTNAREYAPRLKRIVPGNRSEPRSAPVFPAHPVASFVAFCYLLIVRLDLAAYVAARTAAPLGQLSFSEEEFC